jgi:hypothetical protein
MNSSKVVIALAAAMLGCCTSAFATHPPPPPDIRTTVTTLPAIDPTEVPVPARPRVNLSTTAVPSFASYIVTLDPSDGYPGKTFHPVYFRATTTVVNVGEGESPVAGQVAAFDFVGAVFPSPDCTVTTTPAHATSTIECTLTFSPYLVSNGPPAAPFSVTVKTPTAGQRIKFVSETKWMKVGHGLRTEGTKPAIYFDLLSPSANPTLAETVLPFATGGTVTTGTGAATCDNPWVVSVKVPQPATVSLNTAPTPDTPPVAATCAAGDCEFFAQVRIPQATFAPTNPLVTTLRRDRCTIEGRGIIGKALQILEESIFYRPDEAAAYAKVYPCRITGGPVPGIPCIASRGVYTIFNLPNAPDKFKYLGDHFWVIKATENGKYAIK